jgi:hypothetical protein
MHPLEFLYAWIRVKPSTEILEMPALCGLERLVLLDCWAILYLNKEMNLHAVKDSYYLEQDPDVATLNYC